VILPGFHHCGGWVCQISPVVYNPPQIPCPAHRDEGDVRAVFLTFQPFSIQSQRFL
jgi:hypothetical protein